MRRWMIWWLGALLVQVGGCATLCGEDELGTVPRRVAVRIQSGTIAGSGCLILSRPRYGCYVLTAAHLIQDPSRTLVAVGLESEAQPWCSARVLRLKRELDLALLWLPDAPPGSPQRVIWARSAPDENTPVVIMTAVGVQGPEAVPARIVRRGFLRVDRALRPGMSGSGVFAGDRLVGLLFGQTATAAGRSPLEGRFLPVELIQRFLDVGFGFLAAGRLPAEPG